MRYRIVYTERHRNRPDTSGAAATSWMAWEKVLLAVKVMSRDPYWGLVAISHIEGEL